MRPNATFKISAIIAFLSIIALTSARAQQFMREGEGYKVGYLKGTMPDYHVYFPKTKNRGNQIERLIRVTSNETETEPIMNKRDSKDITLHIFYPELLPGASSDRNACQVIVFGYGGGFIIPYEKPGGPDESLQRYFASRGYIVVAVDYRIGIDLLDSALAARAVWRGLQDMRKAIRYCRNLEIRDEFKVDPQKPLVYMGYSAGGVIGLHNLYMNDTLETSIGGKRPICTTDKLEVEYRDPLRKDNGPTQKRFTYDLGPMDCPNFPVCEGLTQDQKNKGVQDISIILAGAIGKLEWINTKVNKPLYMIQCDQDGVVPAPSGIAYKNYGLFSDPEYMFPTLHGCRAIHNRFNQNSRLRPNNYKYSNIKLTPCSDQERNECIQGDAGNESFFWYKTWYHAPHQDKGELNTRVMRSILDFIQSSSDPVRNMKNTEMEDIEFSEQEISETEWTVFPNPV
nr:alpha/beta hydrolase [Leptospira sp.]